MNDIMNYLEKINREDTAPLSYRLRPTKLEDYIGQDHILGEGKLLRRMIVADRISSMILYGPPGCGKTSLSKVIASVTKSYFAKLNATTSGKKEVEEVIKQAKNNLSLYNQKTILFIDEIHRFNKGQQDYLLPYVEDGTIILIGATTENPFFYVNSAILSRVFVFELKKLTKDNLSIIIDKAIGSFDKKIIITHEAREMLIEVSSGDARRVYNAIELAVITTEGDPVVIDKEIISDCTQKPIINYDKDGDGHYDTISAFIKSIRGSDPDASLYYLAKMLNAGEDIRFIARRMIVLASEDIGLADINAINIATSTALAVEKVGMPEARIILSNCVLYMATSPKSNSVMAIDKAIEIAKNNYDVPSHLRDSHYSYAGVLGRGIDYKYPHNYDKNYVYQQYLPDEIKDIKIYKPSNNGNERNIKEYLLYLRGENEIT